MGEAAVKIRLSAELAAKFAPQLQEAGTLSPQLAILPTCTDRAVELDLFLIQDSGINTWAEDVQAAHLLSQNASKCACTVILLQSSMPQHPIPTQASQDPVVPELPLPTTTGILLGIVDALQGWATHGPPSLLLSI